MPTSSPGIHITRSKAHYRPDIDGLRGVAVLLVLVYHGFARFLPGGFIGVDIFFVISGYLITSILVNDLNKNRFSIARFYARRIKRIFPALATVLAVTCGFGWLVLFPDEFRQLGKHVAGGVAFISNLLLWRETGYFNNTAELKPLLHLWSLGIEEQFYIFFPLLLWLAYRKGWASAPFLVILLLISLGLSIGTTPIRPIAAFFLPFTRFWELLVGCTLAMVELKPDPLTERWLGHAWPAAAAVAGADRRFTPNAMAGLGLALIIAGAFYLNKNYPFPGFWALLPTVGAALVIFVGRGSFLNRWLLSNRILVSVGLISYPLYLWHWPLLYFGRILLPTGMSDLTIAAILVAAGLLAALTYLLIERPIRYGGLFQTKKVLCLSVGMAGLLVFGLLAMRGHLPSRWGRNPQFGDIGKAASEFSYPFPNNWQRTSGFKVDAEIVRGKPEQAILFVGDSHMQYYWPRIEQTLNRLQGNARPVMFVTSGASPTLPNVDHVAPGFTSGRFFDFAMQTACETNVATVVFSCSWEEYFIGHFPIHDPHDIYRVGDEQKTLPSHRNLKKRLEIS